MRLVVDTNVFVSAALKDVSWPATTLRWIARYGGLLKSTGTEDELFAVLRRPRLAGKIDQIFIARVRQMFAAASPVVITERIKACRDPEDDMFLELAVNGRADVIISGDSDLLALDVFRDIPIVTPAAFVRAQVRQARTGILRWRAWCCSMAWSSRQNGQMKSGYRWCGDFHSRSGGDTRSRA